MSVPTSSTVASWELALRLRQRREQVGLDARTVAEAMGFTRNYWSAVENERKVLSEENLNKVFDLFEFDQRERDELRQLRAATRQRDWWTYYSMLDPEIQRLYGLEAGARSVKGYESILVPGILQIADYARAIIAPAPTIREVEIDQLVDVRLKRQERLSGATPLRLTSVLSEAVLWQQIGGPAILRRQLQHLINMFEEHPDTISIHVIPFTATSCELFGSATVHILDFQSSMLPMVAWQETVTSYGIIEDRARVRDITTTYAAALKIALDPQESTRMIRRRIDELA
ncbi:MAG TPA: helix-turn-helix transcriptional regulator [Pseudonocardiaceae bacterium]|nr:helix-turn-helix transcriptional regulator [Pseudonocardiaceae bacterium]